MTSQEDLLHSLEFPYNLSCTTEYIFLFLYGMIKMSKNCGRLLELQMSHCAPAHTVHNKCYLRSREVVKFLCAVIRYYCCVVGGEGLEACIMSVHVTLLAYNIFLIHSPAPNH